MSTLRKKIAEALEGESLGRNVPRKPRLVGGVKGHNMNEISLPGSPALWAGSFTCGRFRNCSGSKRRKF
jgi:hypothetical protein